MKIMILSEKDRKAIHAAMNTMVERAEEAAEEEFAGSADEASMRDEAKLYARLARRFGRKSERQTYEAWRALS